MIEHSRLMRRVALISAIYFACVLLNVKPLLAQTETKILKSAVTIAGDGLDQAKRIRWAPPYLNAERPTRYTLPNDFTVDQKMPLMISLHGYGSRASWHDDYWRLESLTKVLGIFLITPEGRRDQRGRQFWSATEACCNFGAAPDTDADYLLSLVHEAEMYFNIDRQRIAVMGYSNGGFMAYRMGCDHADIVTHVAALAGTTFLNLSRCKPQQAVSIFHLHGTWDGIIEYAGQSAATPKEYRTDPVTKQSALVTLKNVWQ